MGCDRVGCLVRNLSSSAADSLITHSAESWKCLSISGSSSPHWVILGLVVIGTGLVTPRLSWLYRAAGEPTVFVEGNILGKAECVIKAAGTMGQCLTRDVKTKEMIGSWYISAMGQFLVSYKFAGYGEEEMTQWLRVHTILAEDLSVAAHNCKQL